MNRETRRADTRNITKLIAHSKIVMSVCLDKETKRFVMYSTRIEADASLPAGLMAGDLVDRLHTSTSIMNKELDRFDGVEARARERSRLTGRDYDEVFKEELAASDTATKK